VRYPVHYAWKVAAVIFVVLLAAAGVRATPSVLIVPLEQEFGWNRALISSAVSVNLILYGLVGPFAAAVMQSAGIRRTVIASLALAATGFALTTAMRTPWQLVLFWGVLVGLGTGTTAIVLGATIVQRWFTARRGLVMGVLAASTATGQLVFLPILASLVARSGWRSVSVVVAGTLLVVIPIVFFVVRDHPSDLGLLPYGASPDDPPVALPRANPLANWIVAAHQIGAGLGALGAGIVRTELSTYTPAWVTAGLICMIAAALVLGIGRSPRRLSAAVWTDDRDALAPVESGR
jgi:sugar phosphate permease